MSDPPPPAPTLPYAPQPIAPGLTLHRAPAGLSIVITPTRRSLLPLLIAPAVALLVSIVLVSWPALAGIPHPPFGPTHFLIPAGVTCAFFIVSLLQSIPRLFPITLTLTHRHLELHWRSATRANILQWERTSILDVSGRRARINNNLLKKRGLLLARRDLGEVMILHLPRQQLDPLVALLRKSLGLPSQQPAALSLRAPRGLRLKRHFRAQTLVITLPPLRRWLFILPSAALAIAAGLLVAHYLHFMNGDEETAFQTFIRGLLALIAGASTCAALSYPLRTFRSTTTFLVTPTALRVIETGFRAPLNTQWSVADILSIAPLPNPARPARSALQLTFSASPPLLLLPNPTRPHRLHRHPPHHHPQSPQHHQHRSPSIPRITQPLHDAATKPPLVLIVAGSGPHDRNSKQPPRRRREQFRELPTGTRTLPNKRCAPRAGHPHSEVPPWPSRSLRIPPVEAQLRRSVHIPHPPSSVKKLWPPWPPCSPAAKTPCPPTTSNRIQKTKFGTPGQSKTAP